MLDNKEAEADQLDGEIFMLGDYPFYTVQPSEGMDEVFEDNASKVRNALGEDVLCIHRMGSSAIRGMPGTPVVDLLAVIKKYPLTESQIKALKDNGFPGPGVEASHAKGDTWFFGGQENIKPGHLGRSCLHVVGEGNPFIQKALSFVGYVSENKDAFEAYKAIKLEGVKIGKLAEQDKLSTYKMKKHNTVLRLMDEAREWAKER